MKSLFATLLAFILTAFAGCAAARPATTKSPDDRIPVILDTDIGNDIDDTWAIALLLRSPRFDIKLISTTDGQPEYRARLIAKLLTLAGRTDIPIALGPDAGKPTGEERESRWLNGFQLSDYSGVIHRDAPQAIIDIIHHSPRPITLIAIGPLQTLAATLHRDPSIAASANLVGMQGSVFKGYGGSPKPDPEFNVKAAIPAAQTVLSAPWRSIAITPLDTCGLPDVSIKGTQYQSLRQSSDPLVRAVLDSYASWANIKDPAQQTSSTVLYDTVAIYLADPDHRSLLQLQSYSIAVTDEGRTIVSPAGRSMTVATGWNDLAGYRAHLVELLMQRK